MDTSQHHSSTICARRPWAPLGLGTIARCTEPSILRDVTPLSPFPVAGPVASYLFCVSFLRARLHIGTLLGVPLVFSFPFLSEETFPKWKGKPQFKVHLCGFARSRLGLARAGIRVISEPPDLDVSSFLLA